MSATAKGRASMAAAPMRFRGYAARGPSSTPGWLRGVLRAAIGQTLRVEGGRSVMAGGRKRRMARISILYALFGALATGCNLGMQGMVHMAWAPAPGHPDMAYWCALAWGTGVGLVVKYLLDKRWIFADRSTGMVAHGRRFALYTVMGASTTVVFWTMQTSFFMIWQTQNMLMLGGALGLAIGYFVKYRLDKRFVFDRAKGAA
jgi:putative flippase GtrA